MKPPQVRNLSPMRHTLQHQLAQRSPSVCSCRSAVGGNTTRFSKSSEDSDGMHSLVIAFTASK